MSKASILIVEDEAIVAKDLSQKLARLGYDIAGVTGGGAEAVDLAREHRPDLVLMDIRLQGGMDGVEAAQAIHRDRAVPVIYLTAHADAATLERAKLTEPFGYILKPFEERQLESHIQMALYRHQAEERVRQEREWLRVTLHSIGDGVITTDAAGRVTFLNPVAEELTGWKLAEALGRPVGEVFSLINEETRKPAPNPVERALREGKVVGLANHSALISREGKERAIDDSAAPIKDSQGRLLGVVMVFHDVTEKRRAEAALLAKTKELEFFNRAMVGRELRMIELKKEVDELCRRFGLASRYGHEAPPTKVAEPPPSLP
jgi:two-component system, cell cycle sensor histidine kinase and response regulator CckA